MSSTTSPVAAQQRGRQGEVASIAARRIGAQIRGPLTTRGNWAAEGARAYVRRRTRVRTRDRAAEWDIGR